MYEHLYVLTLQYKHIQYKHILYVDTLMFCSVPGDRGLQKVRGSKAQTTDTSRMVQPSYQMQLTLYQLCGNGESAISP